MEFKDISHEQERTYIWRDGSVIIKEPQKLFIGKTTHRVVDSLGDVYCVPSVGYHGCYIVWTPKDKNIPVMF